MSKERSTRGKSKAHSARRCIKPALVQALLPGPGLLPWIRASYRDFGLHLCCYSHLLPQKKAEPELHTTVLNRSDRARTHFRLVCTRSTIDGMGFTGRLPQVGRGERRACQWRRRVGILGLYQVLVLGWDHWPGFVLWDW